MPAARIRDLFDRFYPEPAMEERCFRRQLADAAAGARRGLDFGCGSGAMCDHDIRNEAGFVVGLDSDSGAAGNPFVSAVVLGQGTALPFRSGVFGVVAARYVFEHLAEPLVVLNELARVVTPGGKVVLLTPNVWHYVTVVARLTPSWIHRAVKRRHGLDDADVFHTRYRANSARALRRLAADSGFRVAHLEYVESSPNYLEFSRVLYRLGIAYERIVSRWTWLRGLRVNLVVTLERL